MQQPDPDPPARPRDRAFVDLRAALPATNLAAAMRCAARLHAALPHPEELSRNLVLVAYGGGKDSSYMLAFVRAMQLILYRVHSTTFRMRVATNRHAGMPRAVLENIDRAYRALALHTDPDCELLLVDGDEIVPFDVDLPQREQVVRRNRLDILMTGHRTHADGRPTFCNACNLSMLNGLGRVAAHGDGADVIITGDSEREQRQYSLWVARLYRRLSTGLGRNSGTGFRRVLAKVDGIAQAYHAEVHGADAVEAIAERRVSHDVPERLRFFSIYADTQYAVGDHLELLTDFLGFRFDDIAFSFTESDCGNPALMAHLRALKTERLFRRDYAEGLAEYVTFALDLMRMKDIPDQLVEQMRRRYAGAEGVHRMRRAAEDYAHTTFGLTEEQLVCMVYAPFAGKGAGLDQFLGREHPHLSSRLDDIHHALDAANDAALGPVARQAIGELTRISGLDLPQLRVLYRTDVWRTDGGGSEPISLVLADDPHKAVIATRHTPTGPQILEQISGR